MDEVKHCALWWWSHGVVEVKVFDNEAAAVKYGLGIEDDDSGSIAGVQFADGRYVGRHEWQALSDEQRRQIARWRDDLSVVTPPRPSRLAVAPWGDDVVSVDADMPSWVGRKGT